MKKIIFLFFIFLFGMNGISAANTIYSIDMNIYVDKTGTATITETWNVKGSDGTEWYKNYFNLNNSKIQNFTVSMDGKPLTYKSWNVNENLNQKKGYYGINYTKQGLELCFGKYDYNNHIFQLKYQITNFVFNTSDAQVVYWNLLDTLSNVHFANFTLQLSSYYSFPNTLDIWGFGYKGTAIVENGVIKLTNTDNMNHKYVVLLAKFPLNTFQTSNTNPNFSDFNSVLSKAQEGSYTYSQNHSTVNIVLNIILTLFFFLFPFIFITTLLLRLSKVLQKNVDDDGNEFVYENGKKIKKKDTPYFRDIPCNGDIYYANTLWQINRFDKNRITSRYNILGAILLKWIKMGKIEIQKNGDTFNKNKSTFLLHREIKLIDEKEIELFDMIYIASKDGILEPKELEKWVKKHAVRYTSFFRSIQYRELDKLELQGHIKEKTTTSILNTNKRYLDDKIYNDSIQLYGLKLFLENFTRIQEKEAITVKVWEEYLMFAYIFGIADKMIKQFKDVYPQLVNLPYYDLNTLTFICGISLSASTAAKYRISSSGSSYSSGGGGFSSGGGGGGSSGGGGGGSR